MNTLPLELSRLTTEQVRSVVEGEALPLVLLPIGSSEPHGPHLPLGTDTVVAGHAARRAAEALRAKGVAAFVAPTVPYGAVDLGEGRPGAAGLPQATVTRLVAELCRAFLRDGWRHVCVVNHHLEPTHLAAVHAAVLEVNEAGGGDDAAIVPVSFPNVLARRWSEVLGDEPGLAACHAGRYETSLVLAADEGLVEAGALAGLPPRPIPEGAAEDVGRLREAAGPGGYLGEPARATPKEGQALFEQLTAMIVVEVLQALGQP